MIQTLPAHVLSSAHNIELPSGSSSLAPQDMSRLDELEALLELDGVRFHLEAGYWTKFEVRIVKSTSAVPHGLRYSLTLHDRSGRGDQVTRRRVDMKKQVVRVGILGRQAFARRTIAIAEGLYKPKPGEPKIWFESLRSLAEVLSGDNQELLRLIVNHDPRSLGELEALSGRKKSNLSRTLKMLEGHGIVTLERENGRLVPRVAVTDFQVEFGLNTQNGG
jgi:predicted transcriptional regulator